MAQQFTRYVQPHPTKVAEGWTLERLTPPSRLFGANGLRTGPDGRIYVAQVSGSQISAIDVDTGAIESDQPAWAATSSRPTTWSSTTQGNLYVTEITEGRVSVRAPNGTTRVIHGDMPVANPITFHQGRLIAGECRMGGAHHGARPQWRRAARSSSRTCRCPTPSRSGRTASSISR